MTQKRRPRINFINSWSGHTQLERAYAAGAGIRHVLIYGSETWVLTKREENQLLVYERKVLRTICGSKV
jgi:hypothetical protein